MKDISKKFENILNDEMSTINKKIKGTSFLEALKFNILEKFSSFTEKFLFEKDECVLDDLFYEDDQKKITSKMNFYKNPKIMLNTKTKNNLLLICISGLIKIDVEDLNTAKFKGFNLIKNTGIPIPSNTNCNFNYSKNSLVLEIELEDKNIDIENLKENTI